ncbi:MAG TPA: bifunctional DNA-formamidopyrimidine glycosylase/DNA-(apurinic or apyrimidinic site) lyase [Planctomycetaceae bacterium]|nr:bifunctional DNA-formamidopyrimidine glycosylase/DNA-(apurinic or apyrimidinic site) lyase [Planctomycetaceae bacterium]
MPELPEVETMRLGIAPVVGSRIVAVEEPPSGLRPLLIRPPLVQFRRQTIRRRIVEVARAGKRLVLCLDSGDRIVLEPRMTGRILVTAPPDRRHLRLVVRLEGGPFAQLVFWSLRGLGSVQLLDPEAYAAQLGPTKLGPDALEVTASQLRHRLGASRRAVKVALMDQHAIAGIGNLYASEILHRARLHPATPCERMRSGQWERLHTAIGAVLREAIEWRGSTLADGQYRDAENRAGQFQHRHRVYQKAGQRCSQCGRGRIRGIVQAGRSTFYCPVCQRRARGIQ